MTKKYRPNLNPRGAPSSQSVPVANPDHDPVDAAEARLDRDKERPLIADQRRQREEAAAAGRISNRNICDDAREPPWTDEQYVEALSRPTTDKLPPGPPEPPARTRKGVKHRAPVMNLAMQNVLMQGSTPAETVKLNLAAVHLMNEWRQASRDAEQTDAPTDTLSSAESPTGVDAINLMPERRMEEWTEEYLKKLCESGGPPSADGEPWNIATAKIMVKGDTSLMLESELGRQVMYLRQVGDAVFNEQGHLVGRAKDNGKIDNARIRYRGPKGAINRTPDPPNLSDYETAAIPRNTRRGRRQGEIGAAFMADGVSYPTNDDPPAFDPIAISNAMEADDDRRAAGQAKLDNWRTVLKLPHLYDALDRAAAGGKRPHECAGKPIAELVGKPPDKRHTAIGLERICSANRLSLSKTCRQSVPVRSQSPLVIGAQVI
jgi:hypothetical protein